MLTLWLSLCLTADPAVCEVTRGDVFATEAACQSAGRTLGQAQGPAPGSAKDARLQAWACGDASAAPDFWVSEVAPGVFVHKGRHGELEPGTDADLANIAYVIGAQAVAVIDAGGSDAVAEALLADIRRRSDLPVSFLILTHMHPDHTLGAGVFVKAGARVLGHPALGAELGARHGHYHAAFSRELGPLFAADAAPPKIIAAPDLLDLGGRRLRIETVDKGHTSTDLIVTDEQTGTLLLGDVLFVDHLPVVEGSINGWIDVTEDLMTRATASVVPGHGPVLVDWPEGAEPQLDYLKTLRRQVRDAIGRGVPMLEAITDTPMTSTSPWLLTESFHPRNVTAAYRELEWE